jgi:hypothetical protein
MSIEKLKIIYNNLKKSHGKPFSSNWLYKNGHAQFYKNVRDLGLSWYEFLKIVDTDHPAINKKTKKELIHDFRAIHLKYGKICESYSWFLKNKKELMYQILKEFTSWAKFKNSIGLKPKSFTKIDSSEELIKKYKEIIQKHGEVALNYSWLKERYSWVVWFARKFFGTFLKLKKILKINTIFKICTIKELILEYQQIRKIHPEAKCLQWIRKNCPLFRNKLVVYCRRKKNIKWSQFKRLAGYTDFRNTEYKKKELLDMYKKLRKEEGDKAKFLGYLTKKLGCSFEVRIREIGLPWKEFKKIAGFNDQKNPTLKELIKKYKKLKSTLTRKEERSIQYFAKKLFNLSGTEFKRKAGFKSFHVGGIAMKTLIEEYKKIRKEHGQIASRRTWLHKNYGWVDGRIKISWVDFKRKAGFDDLSIRNLLKDIGFSTPIIRELIN